MLKGPTYDPVTNECSVNQKSLEAVSKAWPVVQVDVIWMELEKCNEYVIQLQHCTTEGVLVMGLKFVQVLFGMGISRTKLFMKLFLSCLYRLICETSKAHVR